MSNKLEMGLGHPLDRLKNIARKYGVEVTDGADRGIRAIGILGGASGTYSLLKRAEIYCAASSKEKRIVILYISQPRQAELPLAPGRLGLEIWT